MLAQDARASVGSTRGALLIADHEEALLRDLAQLFRTEGYETHVAPDDEVAVEIVHREAIDVVVLELELPRSGGLGVLRVVRSARGPHVPCVLTAAEVSGRVQVDAFLADAFTVVPKPLDARLLKEVVELALRRHRVA